jgi:uncharacterized damage-inducible protein DinB
MSLAASLLVEFDHEMQLTRRMLERVPEDKFDWQPHPKSMKLGRLASHLAELPTWGSMAMETEEFDVMPVGKAAYAGRVMANRAEILSEFDTNAAAARKAIAAGSDAQFGRPWTLKNAGKPVFTIPKVAVLRSMVMNHMIHHRAQLGLFLRLNDVEIPGTYGPSADDSGM